MSFNYSFQKSWVIAELLKQIIERQNAHMPMQHGYT